MNKWIGMVGLVAVAAAFYQFPALSQEEARVVPAPALDETASADTSETAVLSGGCFWGVQGVFQHLKGVKRAVSGYSGGRQSTADYETVSTGRTGHAESVQLTFDPHVVTYGQILQVFFSVVQDPTELNYQGPDHGTQYRSAIFPQSAQQKEIAQHYIAQLDQAHVFGAPIVTAVEEFHGFFAAEDYHQDFLTLNPDYPYIVYNDLPKLRNFKRLFPDRYREQAVLVGMNSPR